MYFTNVFVLGQSFSGREFDDMDEEKQKEACRKAKLFSRVEPSHKSKIVDYLQKDGAVSAMVSTQRSGYSSLETRPGLFSWCLPCVHAS